MSKDATQNEKPNATPKIAAKNPFIGALKGLTQVAAGQDLAEPADPNWGKQT
jgi:hypothetical protein